MLATERKILRGHGARVVRFGESWIYQTKGRWAGKLLEIEPWQQDFLDELFLVYEDGERVYQEALLGISRKNGKALALDTPIPTPGGWTTMGELQPGDEVFAPDGRPIPVLAATDAMEGRPCYRVTFSDGASIVADAEHEWLTDDRQRGLGVRTTAEIVQTVNAANGRRHRIPVAAPLDLPDADLPLDPYTLGAWLGDGHTDAARLTNVDPEVWDAIPYAVGVPTHGGMTRTLLGLSPVLRSMGLLGHKHIPEAYLRASERQRMALLRGLMDTDGTVSKRGMCEFDTTNARLMADVLALVRSLGWKANAITRRATLYGADCGPQWRIQFTAYADRPVFTIPRKLARQKPPPANRTRSQVRQIVAVESVESVPVKCIQVPGGLYLAGEHYVTTHNSTISAVIALYLLMASHEQGPEVYAAAASADQARIVFDQARAFVEASPKLRDWLTPQRSAILCKANGGVFRVLSSDAPLQYGLNPSGVVIDELWAHKNPELYYALTTAQGARENPLVVSITTAGYDRDTVCYELYRRGKEMMEEGGIHRMREDGFLFKWYEAPPTASVLDPTGWEDANPSSWIRAEDLERSAKRLPESVFRRLHLNQWTESKDSWIKAHEWDACKGEPVIDFDKPVYMAVDVGIKRDSAAVTWVQWGDDDKLHVGQDIMQPEDQPEGFGVADIRANVGARATGSVKEIAYDPWNFRESAELLAERGLPLVEFPQNASRMAPASENLYELIIEGRLVHDGNPVMREQVLAAVIAPTDRGGWRISKRKSLERIDATVSLTMAADRAVTLRHVKPKQRAVIFT